MNENNRIFACTERILSNVAGGGQPVVDIGTELPTIKGGNPIDLAKTYAEYVRHYFNETANQKIYCENNGIIYDSEIDIFSMQELFKKALSGYAPDKLYYFNANHLGSGSLITDEHGQTYQTLIYAPHGEVLLNKFYGDYDEPYKFTGYEKDNESGLNYAHNRYLWNDGGFFTSTDKYTFQKPNISGYAYCDNDPVNKTDPDGNNPIDPRTGKEISMNLYSAAVYDDYDGKQITPVLDKSLYETARPYNYYTRRQFCKPDGMWEGAASFERGYNLSNLSSGAVSVLKGFFPDIQNIDAAYRTPDDYKWMNMAAQGSYVFVDNTWSESLWLHSTIKSFNIMTVSENRVTQIVNLTRSSGKDKYNINSVTSFDISAGDIQSRQKRTWWGGTKTEQYRMLNVTETTQNYKNNQPNGNATVKKYQTEEIVK